MVLYKPSLDYETIKLKQGIYIEYVNCLFSHIVLVHPEGIEPSTF